MNAAQLLSEKSKPSYAAGEKMNPYTNIDGVKFSGEKRLASMSLIEKAIKEGRLMPLKLSECFWCGQSKGIKHYHCEDYDNPVEDAICLCWRCHMIWHSRFRKPEATFKYIYEVMVLKKQYPAVFQHNFDELKVNGM